MADKKNDIPHSGILHEKDKLDKEAVLEQLALEISRKFNIEKKEALALIKSKTLENLDNLKSQLNENNLNKNELEKLFLTLKGAQEVVEKYSKNEIQILREDVEQSINIAIIVNPLEKHLPNKLVEKAKDPKALHEHILGFTLGTANSLLAIADVLYQIGAGIIKAPYHLYLVLSGKGEIEGIDEI